ncbi:aldo/keto reductase [Fulvivirgaceae bacterium PWU5]|uniref:Aldo/keto reductase n=1 Tax=Dawidia cretensis TaxID=2782350 RepID=A0AAP2E141_9BACT|nr:aldo/keto reductase [Dawidia cretensis]MBT1709687.1 aldo/keto reductase [Dawidia cretensis]
MNYRPLSKTSLRISEISFGCMSLGDDHAANKALLHQAFDRGINYFDTADLYQGGFNEETVGRAFAGMRDKVIIATKVGNQLRADGSGWDWNPRKEYILQAVEASLRRLQTDHIDLYQLHGGTIDDPIDETIEAFELLQKQGKIRHYGISSIRPNVIREYCRRSHIVSVMMQYSVLDRRPEESCLELLQRHQIGVLVRGGLASGLLINKPAKTYLAHSAEAVEKASAAVQRAVTGDASKTSVALGYVLHHPAVTSAVVGIRTDAQLTDIVEAARHTTVSESSWQELQQSVPQLVYDQHR